MPDDTTPQPGDRFYIFSDGPFPGADGTIVEAYDDMLLADLDDGRRVVLHPSEIHVTEKASK